ncbi:protein disulfide-isomerase precursor [Fusarium torreyae]|uniref:Protein disulfide-isomerase n=1 Tax=Fusarium torreyae TaxID=1237075 RepID=A0A9W8V957_9HYPO|nr:protein disulfide-isomerase precursor [Fusarium torreyae]
MASQHDDNAHARVYGCKECDRVQEILDGVSPVLTKTAIASVNCNEEPMVCDDSKVFTVSTLKFTTGNNELTTYKESLDASSVVKYIERQSGSPVVDLTGKNHLDFARSTRVAVVAFFGSDCPQERETFNAVAERWRAQCSFGSVDGLEQDSKGPSIAVYTQEEEGPVYYHGPFTVADVEAFLRGATQPLIREFDPIVHEEVTKDEKPLVEFNVPWCQYCTDLHVQMNELGSKYEQLGLSDKVALANINVDANDVPIEIDSYPSIRLYRAGSNEIVSFHGNLTQMLTLEQLDTFASQSGSHGVSVFNQNKAHDEL